ncbi:MAG: response regulator [Chromatiales bacterium]
MSVDKPVTSARHQTDSKPQILIADDSRVVRVSLKNILQQDYQIIEAEDGAKAWDILCKEPGVRLVFSDLSMPNLDGLGLLDNLRHAEDERIRSIPFIVVTGKDEDDQIRNQLLHQGANDLISKPFNNQEITERAKRHIRLPQTTRGDTATEDELLTGITNKIRFTQIVKKELSFAIRNKNELALLLLKLDQFDTIKQHYSDPAIEHILITTAEIIRTHTHIDDKIAYFGEGTFAILRPASNAIGTRYLGKRILSDLEAKKFYIGESGATVTASIGVSAPDIKPATTFSEILHLAEQRLQAAINAGGQRVVDKGNATITPVSTLLPNDDEESERQRILKQTEKEMRELANQELEKIRANRQFENEIDSSLTNAQEINDALLLADQENKLIKEELAKLRLQAQDYDRLKKQLHQTDSLLQQTQLKFKQLQSDHEALRAQKEVTEAGQGEWMEPNYDNTIVEQHLLQENDQLQKDLNAANQRFEEAQSALRKSEQINANFKQHLMRQKEEFNLALSDERNKSSRAEQRITELEAKIADTTKQQSQLSLSPTPSVPTTKIARAPASATSTVIKVQQSTQAHPTKPISTKSTRIPGKKKAHAHKGRLSKIVIVIVTLTIGLSAYLLWR